MNKASFASEVEALTVEEFKREICEEALLVTSPKHVRWSWKQNFVV